MTTAISPTRFALLSILFPACALASDPVNLAISAKATTSFVSKHESLAAIQDTIAPDTKPTLAPQRYGNWPKTGTQWVQYTWPVAISANRISVYWWNDNRGVQLPARCRLKYWNGSQFVPVPQASGLGVAGKVYNVTTFPEITTDRLRLEFDGSGNFSTGIYEWLVFDSGKSPAFPPRVSAGPDRLVLVNADTWLDGAVLNGRGSSTWTKESGPGEVTFGDPSAPVTTARFNQPGIHVLRLNSGGDGGSSDTVEVGVTTPPPATALLPVYTRPHTIDSPLWSARIRSLITTWIPHCVAELSKPGLPEGGIHNFIEAGNKLAGRPFQPHQGAPWANAYVLNTVESICMALMIEPGGDQGLREAQDSLRRTLDEWIPTILSAQEKDGYLQTRFTLGKASEQPTPPPRWRQQSEHEGYVAGYFIEAAIAHHQLTGGKDRRMFDAALRLAGCWEENLGPAPKQTWFDGHQEMEQALMRLADYLREIGEPDRAPRVTQLARFLLDSRRDGEAYDQSHLPVTHQYEVVGHAVRSMYQCAAMAAVARETHDPAYHSATLSLWSNLVNRKYYVTGGIGSGDTSEGFGADYALRQDAYCESCAGCGNIFFQHQMNLAWHDARYIDVLEDSLYNAVLGSMDLEGKNFTYTNALDSTKARYAWHKCPCCIGNIPRTLLMLPEWTYARGPDSLFVNLYIGSTMVIPRVAGTDVTMVQKTDYPWKGSVTLTVNPTRPTAFSLRLRLPRRNSSNLYRCTPDADGFTDLKVNDQPVSPATENGYATITRTWQAGDRVELTLPLVPQRIQSSDLVTANLHRTAFRYGPLIYNWESVDQKIASHLPAGAPVTTQWNPALLGGVVTLHSTLADGSPVMLVPNFSRLNRGGRSMVWLPSQPPQ